MSDFGTGFGAVGNGNSVRGPDLSLRVSLTPSRALLRAASRSRLLAGAGARAGPASRRGPNTSSADFDGVGEPGEAAGADVTEGADDDGAGLRLRSAGVVAAGGEDVVFAELGGTAAGAAAGATADAGATLVGAGDGKVGGT